MQQVTKLKSFFEIVARLGQVPITFLFYIGSFNFMPKPAALYFWCAMAFMSYFGNSLKSLYANHRPYWDTDDIKSDHCSLGFGNPSGHMLNNVFIYVTIYLHAYHEVGVK